MPSDEEELRALNDAEELRALNDAASGTAAEWNPLDTLAQEETATVQQMQGTKWRPKDIIQEMMPKGDGPLSRIDQAARDAANAGAADASAALGEQLQSMAPQNWDNSLQQGDIEGAATENIVKPWNRLNRMMGFIPFGAVIGGAQQAGEELKGSGYRDLAQAGEGVGDLGSAIPQGFAGLQQAAGGGETGEALANAAFAVPAVAAAKGVARAGRGMVQRAANKIRPPLVDLPAPKTPFAAAETRAAISQRLAPTAPLMDPAQAFRIAEQRVLNVKPNDLWSMRGAKRHAHNWWYGLHEALLDRNARARWIDETMAKPETGQPKVPFETRVSEWWNEEYRSDPGVGAGTGKGLYAQLAAREGAVGPQSNALMEGGWFDQVERPEGLKSVNEGGSLPYRSMREAEAALPPEHAKMAGQYMVAKREASRYAPNELRGDLPPEVRQSIVAEVDGNPQQYRAVLDYARQYQGTMRFLIDRLHEEGGLKPEAYAKITADPNFYAHLDRIISTPDSGPALKQGVGQWARRVTGLGEQSKVTGTVSPLMTADRTVSGLIDSIHIARIKRQLLEYVDTKPEQAAKVGITRTKAPIEITRGYMEEIQKQLVDEGLPPEVAAELSEYSKTFDLYRSAKHIPDGKVPVYDPDTGAAHWIELQGDAKWVWDLAHNRDPVTRAAMHAPDWSKLPVRAFRGMVTKYNPGFWMANSIADAIGAVQMAENTPRLMNAAPKAMGDTSIAFFNQLGKPLGLEFKPTSKARQQYKSGGSIGHGYSPRNYADTGSVVRRNLATGSEHPLHQTLKAIKHKELPRWAKFYGQKGNKRYLLVDPVKAGKDWFGEFGDVFETTPRAAEHAAQIGHDMGPGYTPGADLPVDAARRAQLAGARVTVPFSRGGYLTKTLGSVIRPFWNVAQQGGLGQAKLWRHRPKTALKRASAMMAAGWAFYEMNKDRDAYNSQPDWMKRQRVTWSAPNGEPFDIPGVGPVDTLVLSPSREATFFFKLGELGAEAINGKDTDRYLRATKEIIEGVTYDVGSGWVWTPFSDVSSGESSFSGRPINPPGTERVAGLDARDRALVAWPSSTEFARKVAETGWTSLTAAEADYLLGNVVGTLPRDFVKRIEKSLGVGRDVRTTEPKDEPGLGRFFGRYSQSRYVDDFYRERERLYGYRDLEGLLLRQIRSAPEGLDVREAIERATELSSPNDSLRPITDLSAQIMLERARYDAEKDLTKKRAIGKEIEALAKEGLDGVKMILKMHDETAR